MLRAVERRWRTSSDEPAVEVLRQEERVRRLGYAGMRVRKSGLELSDLTMSERET